MFSDFLMKDVVQLRETQTLAANLPLHSLGKVFVRLFTRRSFVEPPLGGGLARLMGYRVVLFPKAAVVLFQVRVLVPQLGVLCFHRSFLFKKSRVWPPVNFLGHAFS